MLTKDIFLKKRLELLFPYNTKCTTKKTYVD